MTDRLDTSVGERLAGGETGRVDDHVLTRRIEGFVTRLDGGLVETVRNRIAEVKESVRDVAVHDADDDGDEDDDDEDSEDVDEDDDEDSDEDEELVTDGGWNVVETPTERTLHGVVHGADGPYVCGESGVILGRESGEWRLLLERGPGVADNTLRSIDATDDGCRIWFAGDSGALGSFDVADGRLSDYSAPMEMTSTWESIAVSGKTDEEHLRIANGSGEVLDVVCEDGCPNWGDVVEPGGGSTIPGLASGPDAFYAIDTSGGAYRQALPTTADADADKSDADGVDDAPDGEAGSSDDASDEPESQATEWERIGVRNAEVDFYNVWAGANDVYVAGADGIAYRHDSDCENWTPLAVGEGALQAIDATSTEAVAVAAGGRIYERADSLRWTESESGTEQSLFDLALARSAEDVSGGLATAPVDVVVGAGGAIVERRRDDS